MHTQPMQTRATTRLYLQDDHCFEADAIVVAVREHSIAFDQTCFYPGGGGQPPDEGFVRLRSDEALAIVSVSADLSTFSKLADTESGLSPLRADLATGEWYRRYGDVLSRDTMDLGYRLVVAK